MELWRNIKQGVNGALDLLKAQALIKRGAVKHWSGKAIYCDVEGAKQFFNKKRLKRHNSDQLYDGFKVRFPPKGALLYRRAIVLPPETCVTFLNQSFPGESVRFFVVSGEELLLAQKGLLVKE